MEWTYLHTCFVVVNNFITAGPTNARQYAVVESFKHAWNGYKENAWGHDNLKPVSGMAYDWFSLGLTIVDALDTAFIMGLTDGKLARLAIIMFTKCKSSLKLSKLGFV